MTDFTCFTFHPDANTIELSSVKIRPVFSCWTCRRCSWQRAGGGYPGGSSPIPPPSLWLGWWSRPDVIAGQVLKYLSEQCTIQQTWNANPKRYDITHTCLFHVQTQTQSWLLQKPYFSLYALPHSKKASTDLRPCFNSERQHAERNKDKREVYAECENCHISATSDKKYHLLSPAAHSSLTLECGPFVRFQT